MTAAALAFVLVPLLRARAGQGPSVVEANLEVLRGQRREIETDVALGALPADARDEALAELVQRAEDDLAAPAATPEPPAASRKPWPLAAALAVAIPGLAFVTYVALGTPGAADPAVIAAVSGKMDDKHVAEMVDALAEKMKERPDDARGWSLLARSMGAMGRFDRAADAYAQLARLEPNSPDVLADYADALAMAQGRTLQGKPTELVNQALKIDPRHQKSLALAGTAAMDAGDFATAERHWQALAAALEPGSPDGQQIQQVIAEVRQRAKEAGKPLPAPSVAAAPAPSPRPAAPPAPPPAVAAATGGKTVAGSVALSPAIASKVKGNEAVFILARAEGGPRVPLAVVRKTARDLPMDFVLDDSQSMAAGMNISSAQAVRVEARISISGNVTPQPGDLVGTSEVIKPGTRDVKIVVDKVLP